jgi:copper chaperone CopZ
MITTADAIRDSIMAVDGVEWRIVGLDTDTATIAFDADGTTLEAIVAALTDGGHAPEEEPVWFTPDYKPVA